jgi:hypothetical protein
MHAKLKQIIRINKAQPLLDQVFFFWYKIRLSLLLLSATVPAEKAVYCYSVLYLFKRGNTFSFALKRWKSY